MKVNEFLALTVARIDISSGHEFQKIRPQIVCNDGVRLSVQASDGHYCSPRMNGLSPYSQVEVGYPSVRPPEAWRQYFDGEWTKPGLIGWFQKVWKNKNMIVYTLKQKSPFKRMLHHYLGFQDNACDSVYGYIPIYLVDDFIDWHGGIDQDKTFTQERAKDIDKSK